MAATGAAWATPAYDRNGNMISPFPSPAGSTATFPAGSFDAWNRSVALTGTGACGYDGFHRRVLGPARPVRPATSFYSREWQVLDETSGARRRSNGATCGACGTWTTSSCGTEESPGTLEERLFALQDANWNVVAIYNASANAVAERFAYTAYGVVLPLKPGLQHAVRWHRLRLDRPLHRPRTG